ncbi:hypothetical protein KVG29_08850 [Caldicoprobacter algeriensis]|uniref:hypothetical protein n=1 Tax=Caldicoprobacter algeriensis TaxID=699281 RepID=UPI00207A0EB5|nr:hypothetical protein [Caldicoprobacter algeriensis]MCM8901327.1 hypothetical protein [Caldicoprobacter algeriensis]
MPIKGKVGAVYLFETAPHSFDTEPEKLEQVGGIFLWEMDLEEVYGYSFGRTPNLYGVTTGWYVVARAFWGDRRLFDGVGETAFMRLFIEPGPRMGCLQGYIIIPELAGEENKINEQTIYLKGIGKPKIGGVS